MGFAAAAWSNPLIVRIFSINKDRSASEWTFQDGSWQDTTHTMPKVEGNRAGQPVAASRSINGSGRYLEFFYAADGKIKYVASNGVGQATFGNVVAEYKEPEPLSTSEKWGIVGAIMGLVSVIGMVMGWCWSKRFRGWVRRTCGCGYRKAAMEDSSSN